MENLAWQLPLGFLIAVFIISLVVSTYNLHKDKSLESTKPELEPLCTCPITIRATQTEVKIENCSFMDNVCPVHGEELPGETI